jgi:phosphoribosyl-ATP pyrophosphohydrolase
MSDSKDGELKLLKKLIEESKEVNLNLKLDRKVSQY